MKIIKTLVTSGLALGMLLSASNAKEVSFEGETIEFIMPYNAGGGTDQWGRFYAPLLSQALPGKPNIIIKNMPGGGSTKGANYFAERASKDGLTIFASSASTQIPFLLGDDRIKYDFKDWYAVLSSPTGGVVYVSDSLGIKDINDIFNQKKLQLVELTTKCLSTKDINFNNYSCNELLELYQKQKSNRLSIEFKDRPLSTDYEDFGIGYIGTVKLSKYKEFLTSDEGTIRDDLFESNIRHFQGLVDVNKKIKKTIETISDKDFWWINNGITIIAEEPKEVGKKLSIENIQIVNGLQTSYSIFNNYIEKNKDERSVLVKVIINNNKEITDEIIASTNSQNPVSATLLRATEQVQRDLELFFLNEGFYYDRRKNFYKNLGKLTTKIFSIQYAAQTIQSIIFNEPHTARATPTSLLKNETTYKNIFDIN